MTKHSELCFSVPTQPERVSHVGKQSYCILQVCFQNERGGFGDGL